MSSVTSISEKNPGLHVGMRKSKTDYFAGFFSVCLWTVAAIITAANTDISPNATGIAVTITTQDVITMLVTTWLLAKGLHEYNHLYVLPWLLISVWNMHSVHYASIIKMMRMLKSTQIKAPLPWVALAIDIFGLFLRAALTFRVAKLSVYQWYQKNLENEILTANTVYK